MHFETKTVHAGIKQDEHAGAVSAPIYLSTSFSRDAEGSIAPKGFYYTRAGNPNRESLEKRIAELELGVEAFAYASGMAATLAVCHCVLSPGAHVIVSDDCYHGVAHLIKRIYPHWGVSFTEVDMTEPANVSAAIKSNTRLILTETPSNPQLKIADIERISAIAKDKGIIVAADNTWATPCTIQPLTLGVDLVIHSSTKYFGGHSDVLGGCVVARNKGEITERLREFQIIGGAVPSPFDCWLILRGISTLAIRQGVQAKNASAVAGFLNTQPGIEKVFYPELKSHPNHEVAVRLMKGNFGAMVSVLVKGGKIEAMKFANSLNLFRHATSLGGVESLVEHRLTAEGDNPKSPENLIRISVGIENINDLIDDLKQALKSLN